MRRAVTLHGPESPKPSTTTVLVPQNQHGQLPAVLVNPIDSRGRVVPGVWLGENTDRAADGAVYRWVKESE
ncbi:hypothetical protein [Glaciibacter sp. 2TAF33]|uniref:hypothetical protein n=1 Tax=Glaciibacter sp. 2TAF33 TaxID=3233015 RepID=UPI003F8EE886